MQITEETLPDEAVFSEPQCGQGPPDDCGVDKAEMPHAVAPVRGEIPVVLARVCAMAFVCMQNSFPDCDADSRSDCLQEQLLPLVMTWS